MLVVYPPDLNASYVNRKPCLGAGDWWLAYYVVIHWFHYLKPQPCFWSVAVIILSKATQISWHSELPKGLKQKDKQFIWNEKVFWQPCCITQHCWSGRIHGFLCRWSSWPHFFLVSILCPWAFWNHLTKKDVILLSDSQFRKCVAPDLFCTGPFLNQTYTTLHLAYLARTLSFYSLHLLTQCNKLFTSLKLNIRYYTV